MKTLKNFDMTQDERNTLLVDLCTRLPYGVKVKSSRRREPVTLSLDVMTDFHLGCSVKPYLRPLSSMTEEEFGFLQEHLPYDFTRVYSGKFDLIDDIHLGNSISIDDMTFLLNCLNKWHLDYRGLIPMGLALEAPE